MESVSIRPTSSIVPVYVKNENQFNDSIVNSITKWIILFLKIIFTHSKEKIVKIVMVMILIWV